MNPFTPAVSDTRRPGDGFYYYVNKHWSETHHIARWQSEFGVSDEVESRTDKELLKILHSLEHLRDTSLHPSTATQHLQLLGHIWKNSSINSNETYLKICLEDLQQFKNEADIARFFGWAVRTIPTILTIGASEEFIEPYAVRATLGLGELLLPSNYYTDKSQHDTDIWKAYEEFVSICSIELGIPYLYKAIEAETQIAAILDKYISEQVDDKLGNRLVSWVPVFEWDAFMEGLDLDPRWQKRRWVIMSAEHIKYILKWMCSADEELVLALLSLHLIRCSARYLRKEIKDAHFKLFMKALNGIDSRPSRETLFLNDIKRILPDALCSLYSEKHRNRGVVENVSSLVEDLRESAVKVMSNSDIFSKKTKSKVKEKLNRMKFEIGNGAATTLPNVTYNPNCLLHTILSINAARVKLIPLLTGKPTDILHTAYPCYIANASYYLEANTIVIPWGILQGPYYFKDAPLGWNHGGIGAIICHEMSHGFDLEGSLYTPRGVFKEWWTRKNRNSFLKRTRKVSTFFSKFKHYGKTIDGKKTLSENWADLGGMTIALHSLNKHLEKVVASESLRTEAHRNFFISYAVCWRTLVRKEKMLYSMLESVHAPSEDRVDRLVPQFEEWVKAFSIKETDTLFIQPAKRLKFF